MFADPTITAANFHIKVKLTSIKNQKISITRAAQQSELQKTEPEWKHRFRLTKH
jgi:hypothetical protein